MEPIIITVVTLWRALNCSALTGGKRSCWRHADESILRNNFRLPPTSTKRKFHFSFLWCLSQVIFSKAIFGETWHQREQRGAFNIIILKSFFVHEWSRTKIYWLTAKNCSKLILFRGTPFIGDIANSKDRLSFLNLHTFVRCHGNVKSTYAKWPQCPVKHAYLLCMQAKLLGII